MFSTGTFRGFPVIVILLLTPLSTNADSLGDAARHVLEANAESVVTARVVVKERWIFGSFEDDTSEYVAESSAFIVADDGTVVTSLSATDPESFFAAWLDDDDDLKIKTEITSLTLIYGDGEELEATVVLRDRDLDLIFMRPNETPASDPPPISLSDPGIALPFAHVVRIERHGHTLKRQVGGEILRVQLVVERPRRFYVIDDSAQHLGAPVFTADGKLLGMVAMRRVKKGVGGERGFWSEVRDHATIVVTAEDIAEDLRQLPTD